MGDRTATFVAMTMARGIRAAMHRAPNKIAVRQGDRQISYREFSERTDAAAMGAVGDLELHPGENVALVARNRAEYLEVTCGIAEAGVAVATINPRMTAAEIAAICDDAEARVVFADAESAGAVRTADCRTVRKIIEFGPEYESFLARGARSGVKLPVVDESSTWTIPYTSGTTGKPKGVMVSHRSRSLVALICASEYSCFGVDDSFLAIAPFSHGGGLAFPVGSLLTGGSVEIMERFDAVPVLEAFKSGRITGVFMVPTHFHSIFSLDSVVLDRYRRPPIKTIISNAAALPYAYKEKIVPYFGDGILHELYGSTEAGLVTNLRPADQLRKPRSVGHPLAMVEVRLLDDRGGEVAQGEVGEIFVRSPMLFNGYWQRPDESAAGMRDGWNSVGDMGRLDDEGQLYIVDRKKDMVISGGVNVYPREIEDVLLAHPNVSDAAVVGVPDDRWGERLCAFLVLRAGGEVDAGIFVEFCRDKLAGYKIPREFVGVPELPRNANGKVLKTELRKRACQKTQ